MLYTLYLENFSPNADPKTNLNNREIVIILLFFIVFFDFYENELKIIVTASNLTGNLNDTWKGID